MKRNTNWHRSISLTHAEPCGGTLRPNAVQVAQLHLSQQQELNGHGPFRSKRSKIRCRDGNIDKLLILDVTKQAHMLKLFIPAFPSIIVVCHIMYVKHVSTSPFYLKTGTQNTDMYFIFCVSSTCNRLCKYCNICTINKLHTWYMRM